MTEPDEARIAWNACAAARFEDEENGNPLGLPQGMPNFDDFKDGYRAGAAASEARIKELEAELKDTEQDLHDYSVELGRPTSALNKGHRESVLIGQQMSAERIKELEARVAELEDMVSRYLIQMSDMINRLKERHPEDFVWLKDGDEPTDEDAYGWWCQGWGERR